MDTQNVEVTEGGKLVIPASFRDALGIATGDMLVMEMDAGELRLRPIAAVIRDVQAQLRALNPTGRVLSEELIAERRREAESE